MLGTVKTILRKARRSIAEPVAFRRSTDRLTGGVIVKIINKKNFVNATDLKFRIQKGFKIMKFVEQN